MAQQPHDNFANAKVLTGTAISESGLNWFATGEVGEPDHALASLPLESVWYRWTAPADGLTTIDTCATRVDTTLAVYTGVAVDNLTPVRSNDDGLLCDDYGGSRFRFQAAEGQTYQIAVDSYGAGTGLFVLGIAEGPPAEPPPNDELANAQSISGAQARADGSILAATGQTGEPDHAGVSAPLSSVWYRWTAPGAGAVFVDVCRADFDTALAVYTGLGLQALTPVVSNDDGQRCGDATSDLRFDAVAGATYLIAVDGYAGEQGDFSIALDQPTLPPPSPGTTNPPPPGPALPAIDLTAPAVRVAGKPLRLSRSGRINVRVKCPAAETSGCTGRVNLRTAKRLRVKGGRRIVRLGSARFSTGPGTAVVRVKVGRPAQRLLRRLGKTRVRVTVKGRDAAGNVGSNSRVLSLKAGRR